MHERSFCCSFPPSPFLALSITDSAYERAASVKLGIDDSGRSLPFSQRIRDEMGPQC